ncbi:hypothetical protein E4T56_gene11653 [Termitomyces sp. T112]|nr:hypothetical protein E4T56_gene11653 [Termitomyces sp. T112]
MIDGSVSFPPEKKHKRSWSSGELPVDQLILLADALENIAREIKFVQAQRDWGDLEELHHLADTTDTVIKQIKRFQNLKNKDENAVIVSFSNVDTKILNERLGMQETVVIRADSSLEVFSKKLTAVTEVQLGSRHLDVIKDTVSDWKPTSLQDTLSIIESSINRKSEAASRIAIDAWLLQGMELIKQMHHTYTVLFPELLIWSRDSETDDPPAIAYDNKITYLAGSTDYGLLNILPIQERIAESRV